jgi:hypothetical protein
MVSKIICLSVCGLVMLLSNMLPCSAQLLCLDESSTPFLPTAKHHHMTCTSCFPQAPRSLSAALILSIPLQTTQISTSPVSTGKDSFKVSTSIKHWKIWMKVMAGHWRNGAEDKSGLLPAFGTAISMLILCNWYNIWRFPEPPTEMRYHVCCLLDDYEVEPRIHDDVDIHNTQRTCAILDIRTFKRNLKLANEEYNKKA